MQYFLGLPSMTSAPGITENDIKTKLSNKIVYQIPSQTYK